MKRWFAIAVVVLQLGLLAYMAGEREWIARTGNTITLRTAPVDPSSPMRGSYVRLDYEISNVPKSMCRDGVRSWFDEAPLSARVRDRTVYAALAVSPHGLAELVGLSDVAPADGIFLRGRVEWLNREFVQVRYGIEAYFMQQDKARGLEQMLRGERRGVPLDVQVAVSGRGTGVLRGYAWEALGITVALERSEPIPDPNAARPAQRRLVALKVMVTNHGDERVAIVDRPDGGSFRLVGSDRVGTSAYRWPGEEAPPSAPTPAEVRVLDPGESYIVRLDLSRPRWFVVPDAGGEPVSLSSLTQAWNALFRVEYVPGDDETITNLPDANLIARRSLRSATFTPAGGVD